MCFLTAYGGYETILKNHDLIFEINIVMKHKQLFQYLRSPFILKLY